MTPFASISIDGQVGSLPRYMTVVGSGNGIHLYYVGTDPAQLFDCDKLFRTLFFWTIHVIGSRSYRNAHKLAREACCCQSSMTERVSFYFSLTITCYTARGCAGKASHSLARVV